MECQQNSSIEEVLKLLHNLTREVSQVKADCQRIKKEILGISDESELKPEGLLESSTIRQVMEKMAFDIEQLKVTAEEDRRRQSEHEKESIADLKNVVQEEFSKHRNDSEQTKELIIADIKSVVQEESNKTEKRELMFNIKSIDPRIRTMEDEKDRLRIEMEDIRRSRPIANTDESSSTEIAPKKTLPPTTKGSGRVLEAEIRNFLDVPVSDLKQYTSGCQSIGSSVTSLPAGSKEVLTFASVARSGWLDMLMSFQVGRSPLSLVVCATAGPLNAVSLLAVFTNSTTVVSQYMAQEFILQEKIVLPYIRCGENIAICANDSCGGEFFIKSGNIRARVKLLPTKTAQDNFLLTVDIGSVQGIIERMIPSASAVPCAQSLGTLDRISRQIRPTESFCKDTLDSIAPEYGALVILGNGLPIELQSPLVHLRIGKKWASDSIASFSSDCFQVYSMSSIRKYNVLEAVITMEIPETDLSLAVAFSVHPNGNNAFGVGFLPTALVPTTGLFEALLSEKDWDGGIPNLLRGTREDMKIANKAGDGAQVIYRRNILARAKLSNEKKAVLELFLTTF